VFRRVLSSWIEAVVNMSELHKCDICGNIVDCVGDDHIKIHQEHYVFLKLQTDDRSDGSHWFDICPRCFIEKAKEYWKI